MDETGEWLLVVGCWLDCGCDDDATIAGVSVAVAISERCPLFCWANVTAAVVASAVDAMAPGLLLLGSGPPLSLESWEQSAATELFEEADTEQEPEQPLSPLTGVPIPQIGRAHV